MLVILRGHALPGASCRRPDDAVVVNGVHIGVERNGAVEQIMPGTARNPTWTTEVKVLLGSPNAWLDFGGPFVRGVQGSRHVTLVCGAIDQGQFRPFARVWTVVDEVDPWLITQAEGLGRALVATVELTDSSGRLRHGSLHLPDVTWTLG